MLLSLLIIWWVIKDIRKSNLNEIDDDNDDVLQINDTSYEDIRLQSEITQEKLSHALDIKRATDVRQFKGREDVTKEEVLEYMFNKDTYVGFVTQQIHLERIQEVCNFSEEDRQWVTHELWGKTKVMEDEEGLAFEKYMNEKQKKKLLI